MLYQDNSRLDFVTSITPVNYDWKGYTTLGADIEGTFSAGSGKFQGGSGGVWTDILTILGGAIVSGGTINTAGHYMANIASFQQGRFLPSSDFSGTVKITANMGVIPLNAILGV